MGEVWSPSDPIEHVFKVHKLIERVYNQFLMKKSQNSLKQEDRQVLNMGRRAIIRQTTKCTMASHEANPSSADCIWRYA